LSLVEGRIRKVDRLPILDVTFRSRSSVEEDVVSSDLVSFVGVRGGDGEGSVGLPPLKLG